MDQQFLKSTSESCTLSAFKLTASHISELVLQIDPKEHGWRDLLINMAGVLSVNTLHSWQQHYKTGWHHGYQAGRCVHSYIPSSILPCRSGLSTGGQEASPKYICKFGVVPCHSQATQQPPARQWTEVLGFSFSSTVFSRGHLVPAMTPTLLSIHLRITSLFRWGNWGLEAGLARVLIWAS